MSKKLISTLFSVVFLIFITIPAILVIVNDTGDVSIVFSISEQEEKGSEKNLDSEILLYTTKTNDCDSFFTSMEDNLEFYLKKYPKPHLNLILPPPEVNIL